MKSKLDAEYERQRRALVEKTTDAIEQAWLRRDLKDRGSYLSPAMTLIDGASQAYVTILSAYFNAKASAASDAEVNHEIDHNLFTAEEIRPEDPLFLGQAYGTYIVKLEEGKDASTANEEAAAYVRTLVKTHLQAIQVRASWLWMATY